MGFFETWNRLHIPGTSNIFDPQDTLGRQFGGTRFSDIFNEDQARELAGAYGSEVMDLLTSDITDTRMFREGSAAIRDATSAAGATARQRLGDQATTGGFLDSGAVNQGLSDIERASIQALGSNLRDLIMGIEDRRFQAVLPFLGQAAGESGLNSQLDLARRGQDMQFIRGMFDTVSRDITQWFGGGGMGMGFGG